MGKCEEKSILVILPQVHRQSVFDILTSNSGGATDTLPVS